MTSSCACIKMAEAQEETVMSKEHRQILRRHRIELVDNLQPLKLLDYLIDVLSPSDEEEIRAEKTSTEQTGRLLDILPRKGSKAFEAFVGALQKKQRFLAIPIAKEAGIELSNTKHGCNEHCMQPDHKEILRSNRSALQELINLEKVLPLMSIVFDKEDIEEISSKPTKHERFAEFISILAKKEDKAFHHFVSVVKSMHPRAEKLLVNDENNLDKTDKNNLKLPTQIVNPVDDTVSSNLKGKLTRFYQETDKNDQWKRLAAYLQIPLEKVQHLPNPTDKVLDEWYSRQGVKATVSELKDGLISLGMNESLRCLEADLINPIDTVDSQITEVVQKAETLSIGESKSSIVEMNVGDLSEEKQSRLFEVIKDEMRIKGYEDKIPSPRSYQQKSVRELTRLLRKNKMDSSIQWMKTNLPSGITGPICDENMNVRDMKYSARSKLTIQLCGNDNWKKLADYFGLSNAEINYFDSHRFKNPADEVLKQWETKRNTTIGELYDILVKLNMPVIADTLL